MPGGEDARLAGRLDEELDDQAVAVAGRRALERRAVPLANRRPDRAGDEQIVRCIAGPGAPEQRTRTARAGRPVGRVQRSLELSHERIGRVGLAGLGLRGERSGPETDARQDEKKSDHWVLALLDAN